MADELAILWRKPERERAEELLAEQIRAGKEWLNMADELYNGPAKRIDDFYSSKEAFREETDGLEDLLADSTTTKLQVDTNTRERLNALDWMEERLKTWDTRREQQEITQQIVDFRDATYALKQLIQEQQATVRAGMSESVTTTVATQI
ncbi:MAG: hypothetical protein RLY61_351 [Candidatus Parcubacteria bacterium]|jgi:vacuolar-type H+-ATPase subunit I/STV1